MKPYGPRACSATTYWAIRTVPDTTSWCRRAAPFDPNGCLFWKGRYHLFYIFQDPDLPKGGHSWGHASSRYLLHWVHHPTALAPREGDPDVGIFSGNGFVNADGLPTLGYFGIDAGICIATAVDDDLNVWEKSPANPVIPVPGPGDPGFGQYNVFDPHAWLEDGAYHVVLGAKVLPDSEYDTVYHFTSTNLTEWDYVGHFYEPNHDWTGPEEDCACPDFFRIGDRHMLLCISHPRGCRYYLGSYDGTVFKPESHHRMNWPGGTCFAPESLLDDTGRRIMWAWVLDCRTEEAAQESGWSGVMTLPRVRSLGANDVLRIEPAEKLTALRTNHRRKDNVALPDNATHVLDNVRGDCMELIVDIEPGDAEQVGVIVRRSPDGVEGTEISFARSRGELTVDVSSASLDDSLRLDMFMAADGDNPPVGAQAAPLHLADGEPLRLRVFLDRSIIEVYANGRQCITQRVYPTRTDSTGVALFARGGSARATSVEACDIAPTNPY